MLKPRNRKNKPEVGKIDHEGKKAPSRSLTTKVRSASRPQTAPSSPERRNSTKQSVDPSLVPPPPPIRVRRSSAPEEGYISVDSNNFCGPQDADGEFVRRTYAHFSAAGVPDDGFTEGKEYTRERNGLSAWEEAALSRPESATSMSRGLSKASTSTANRTGATSNTGAGTVSGRIPSNPTSPLSRPELPTFNSSSSIRANGDGIENSPRTHMKPEQNGSNEAPTMTGSVRSNLSLPSAELTQSPSSGPANSSLLPAFMPVSGSAESALSGNTYLSTDEWRRRQEAAEKKRDELISKIDRYGFFSDGTSTGYQRSVFFPNTLFAAPFPKRNATGIAGPDVPQPSSLRSEGRSSINEKSTSPSNGSLPRTVREARLASDQQHRRKEQERIAKWSRMIAVRDRDQGHNAASYDFSKGIDKKVRRRIFKGIPDIWRSAAWTALLQHRIGTSEGKKSFSLAQNHLSQKTSLESKADLERRFAKLKDVPSSHDVQIDLDVPRTISGHIQFHTRYGQGQRNLFHVLHAISLLCNECGYCQGMGPIAATLLCYLSPEQAYSAMAIMHNYLGLHSTFRPGFPGLVENLFVQDRLVQIYMPELSAVFKEQMVVTSAYATKWYITLFSNSIPFETQLRVWDAWLLEGQDVITLFAVALLWAHRGTILAPEADFETILNALSSYFVPEDDDSLLHWIEAALARKDIRKAILEARTEYSRKLESGEAGDLML